jgi:hypothetical protein
MPARSRIIYSLLVLAVIAVGLLSRRFPQFVPAALGQSPGDALWALMVFLGLGCLCPRAATETLALAALAFSFAVEFSQLHHAPWIDAVRATRLGHLVLGQGFLWTDLLAYTVGIALGTAAEWLGRRRVTSPSA